MRECSWRRSRRPGLGARNGFSLIELLVALLVIDVGLLALTSTTLALVRRRADVRAYGAAVRAASNRLQSLGAGACAPASGSATQPWGVERWQAVLGANSTREIVDSVTFGRTGTRVMVLRTRFPC